MYFDITNQVHEATLSAIKNPMIRECITYLDTHYREKINLEELANTLGYTKYYLSTCFKKETGVSISEYIMEKRKQPLLCLLPWRGEARGPRSGSGR